jgi:hypothetical protein
MKVDSLEELESAFAAWRRRKKYVREPMPEELRARAQQAMKKHGVGAVVRVTRIDQRRLLRTRPGHLKASSVSGRSPKRKGLKESVPAFSRVMLSAPSAPSPRPLAEVEKSGVTLRVFEETPGMVGLLCAACGFGAMG